VQEEPPGDVKLHLNDLLTSTSNSGLGRTDWRHDKEEGVGEKSREGLGEGKPWSFSLDPSSLRSHETLIGALCTSRVMDHALQAYKLMKGRIREIPG